MSAAMRVFFISELLCHIFGLCAIQDLVKFSHCSPVARDLVRQFLRDRIATFTRPFIPTSVMRSFGHVLHCTRAAVVASVASAVIRTDIKFADADLPSNINILIPRGSMWLWDVLLANMGKTMHITRGTSEFLPRHADTVRVVRVYRIWLPGVTREITISESRTASILAPLLASKYTGQMVAITSRHIISVYGLAAMTTSMDGMGAPVHNGYILTLTKPTLAAPTDVAYQLQGMYERQCEQLHQICITDSERVLRHFEGSTVGAQWLLPSSIPGHRGNTVLITVPEDHLPPGEVGDFAIMQVSMQLLGGSNSCSAKGYVVETSDAFVATSNQIEIQGCKPKLQFVAVLIGQGSRFLGLAEVGKHFFFPREHNWNHDVLVVVLGAVTHEYDFKTVIFGSVKSHPIVDWNHTYFRLGCPDWSELGWGHSAFVDTFTTQIDSLRLTEHVEEEIDVDEQKACFSLKLHSSSYGNDILIDIIQRGGRHPIYMVPASTGACYALHCQQDKRSFPFAVGDTVVIEATFHRDEQQFSDYDHNRDYTLVANLIRIVKARDILSSPTVRTLHRKMVHSAHSNTVDDFVRRRRAVISGDQRYYY
ncbi:hypothetical protein B0H10DRAFT_1969074 [Mycena sp. CBHHK59/15]|nr:hypothetical protein B0H10DRAFT_1969074 [Mycena sp. CBHHK59/15]